VPEDHLDITAKLADWSKGDESALADVMPLIYDELRLMRGASWEGRRRKVARTWLFRELSRGGNA